jgi:hypothetical protein
LNDIAVDVVERFAGTLGARLDLERAIRLLADPHCRPGLVRKRFRNLVRSARRRMRRGGK